MTIKQGVAWLRIAPALSALLAALLTVAWISPAMAETDAAALSESLDWDMKRDRDGIQVFTATVPDSRHKAVRGTMQVAAPLKDFVALVLDTEACSDWAALCKESYVAARESDVEFHVYTYNDLPWPVADRDAVAHVLWSVDSESGRADMVATIASGVVDKHKRALRLSEGITSWTFTPNADGTLVESFAHLNPGGGVPAWVTNMLLVDSPFDTLKAMRKVVTSGAYAEHSVSFLETDATPAPPAEDPMVETSLAPAADIQ